MKIIKHSNRNKMKTLKELSKITRNHVIAAHFHEMVCYHLLIDTGNGYYKSYYVEGQKMGITLTGTPSSKGRLPFKRRSDFLNNVENA